MLETSHQFGENRGLAGTICRPEIVGPRRVGLLLTNAGIVPRIGPHRFNVRLARYAAAKGVPSIRFDLSGQGDSHAPQATRGFREQAAIDIRAALTELERQTGVDRFMLFGICSGADNGYTAAIQDSRIRSLVMFDPVVFPSMAWRAKVAVSKFRKYGLRGSIRRAREIRAFEREEPEQASNQGRELPDIGEYCRNLRHLVDRGARIHLIYSGSSTDQTDFDTQRELIQTLAGDSERLSFEFMPETDHVLTSRASQQAILNRFDAWLAVI